MRVALLALLLAASGCYAQEPTAAPATLASESQPQKAAASQAPTVTVPAGTRRPPPAHPLRSSLARLERPVRRLR
ncbi:MAG: hypothetical protein ACLQOO_37140 [Terriglobia bacterium]